MTKYLVTKDIVHNIKGFNTTITAYLKEEIFLYSHSHDHYYMYNLKSSRDIGFFLRGGEGTATKIIEGSQNAFF